MQRKKWAQQKWSGSSKSDFWMLSYHSHAQLSGAESNMALKHQNPSVKEPSVSFWHYMAVCLTWMLNPVSKGICHPHMSEGFTVFYTISHCFQPTPLTISPFYALLTLQGLMIIIGADGQGIVPPSTHCSPPTIIVVEEFHGEGNITGKWAKVLH